jgi:hypothetical protein
LRQGVLGVEGESVLPALVIVALPADTAPADTEVLLDACTQAYEGGRCEEPKDERPEVYVMAELVWVTDTQAEVSVSFETSSTQRSAYRSLDFRPIDEERERYRALGFAVGSLAGKLAHSVEPKTTPTPSDKAVEEERVVEPEPVPEPEPEPAVAQQEDPADPPPLGDDTLPSVYAPLPSVVTHDYRLGFELGTGVRQARWGAMLGARRIYDGRLLLEVTAGASTHGSNPDGIEATFVNASACVGVQFDAAPLWFSVVAGPAFQLQKMGNPSVNASVYAERLGATAGLTVRYSDASFSPFAELRGRYIPTVDLRLPEGKQPFGPWQGEAIVGVVLTSE